MARKTRLPDRVNLQVTTPADAETHPDPGPFASVVHPWIVAGVVGSLAVGLIGWLLTTVWVLSGWATQIDGTFLGTLAFSSRVWLAGMGAGLKVDTVLVTIIPLGLTLLAWAGVAISSFYAARTAKGLGDGTDSFSLRVASQTSVAATLAFVVGVTAVAIGFVEAAQAARVFAVTAIVAGSASWIGAGIGAGWRPGHRWPAWTRRLRAAVGAGLAGLTLLSGLALLTATVANWGRVSAIAAALRLGPVEAAVLLVGQLAFLPNALLWAGSYTLGAGFTVGSGSLVTVSSSTVGLLPAFPIFGLIPEPGATGGMQPLWLVGGAVVGLLVGAIMLTGWTSARDRTQAAAVAGLIGGCTGVVTALAWAGLTATSGGSLGTGRLVDMGPRMLELVALSGGLLGIPAAVAAIAIVALAQYLPPPVRGWLEKMVDRIAPAPRAALSDSVDVETRVLVGAGSQ